MTQSRWLPEIRAALDALLEQPTPAAGPPPIAAFDWDNTCIRGDIGETVLHYLDPGGPDGYFATYERLTRERGERVSYAYCAEVVGRRSAEALREIARRALDEAVDDGRILVRTEMRDLMHDLVRAGWEVWVVSASVQPAVEVSALEYGVAPDRVIGVELAVGEDGTLGDMVPPLTYREGKVAALLARAGRLPTLAAGDWITDLELLESATHRLVIDRGNPVLAAKARSDEWWLQPAFEQLS